MARNVNHFLFAQMLIVGLSLVILNGLTGTGPVFAAQETQPQTVSATGRDFYVGGA